jgi:hypothetical protein
MIMQDPFQSYQTLGAFSGGASPYGLPFQTAQTPGFSPGIPQIPGLNPYSAGLQNPILQSPIMQSPILQNPLVQHALLQHALLQNQLLQNPLLQHPMAQGQWQNPLPAAGLQNPQFHNLPQQQLGYPQQQFSYPLAPQTLIGGQGLPQIHPLALQLALRTLSGGGISPWTGY